MAAMSVYFSVLLDPSCPSRCATMVDGGGVIVHSTLMAGSKSSWVQPRMPSRSPPALPAPSTADVVSVTSSSPTAPALSSTTASLTAASSDLRAALSATSLAWSTLTMVSENTRQLGRSLLPAIALPSRVGRASAPSSPGAGAFGLKLSLNLSTAFLKTRPPVRSMVERACRDRRTVSPAFSPCAPLKVSMPLRSVALLALDMLTLPYVWCARMSCTRRRTSSKPTPSPRFSSSCRALW
mmetsp:Transcript_53608/g.149756  ORF Transcript_53608/g.149756 Transcript_53608/m.149756 type:complete len:239 (+) Transcript_53608:493-1209(+)